MLLSYRICGMTSKQIEWRGILTEEVRLQDNGQVHNMHLAQTKGHYYSYEILPHNLYFPDLAPSDFQILKGKHFSDDG